MLSIHEGAAASPVLVSPSATAEVTAALEALKQATGGEYKAPEIVSFPVVGPTVSDAMAVTGNF